MVVPIGADIGGAAVSVIRATIGRPDGSGVLGRVAALRRQSAARVPPERSRHSPGDAPEGKKNR